jgi:hypothetical protein
VTRCRLRGFKRDDLESGAESAELSQTNNYLDRRAPRNPRGSFIPCEQASCRTSGLRLLTTRGWAPLAGRRLLALIHRCLPSLPRTRPNHSRRGRRSLTHQSSWPPGDQVAISTWIGGSTSRRSASP